jgi:N-acetylmuramoyl-L-alanine amidase
MPSILTEIGYLTNPLEEQFLGSKEGQSYLAKAIFRGFRKYKDELEGNKKDYNDEIENQKPLENENIKAGNIPGQRKLIDEEDEEDEDEKKTTTIKDTTKVKTTQAPKTETITPVKAVETTTTSTQAAETKEPVKEDSIVNANSIIEKFKEKNKETSKTNTIAAVQSKTVSTQQKNNEPVAASNDIKFKVQFASSDVELNLKQEKFAAIIEGAYYKSGNTLKYTSGNFSDFKEAVKHQNSLREKGFKDCFVIAMQSNTRLDVNEARKKTGQ